MQCDRPLLTIAIPTYNRSGCLAELLTMLAPQLAGETRVELVISDNASFDDTPTVIKSFRENGLDLTYNRNEDNIGPDGNFLKCFREARGKYVWLFGDDDFILPGSLKTVLGVLSENEYDLIHVGFFSFPGRSIPQRLPSALVKAEIIEDVREMVRRANHSLSFISANIINHDRVMANIERSLDELIGTNLQQLGWVYSALNHYMRGVHITGPLVAAGDSATASFDFVGVFGPKFASVTDQWLKDSKLRKILYASVLKTLMPFYLIRARRIRNVHADNRSARSAVAGVFRHNYLYWFYNYPIISLPMTMAEWYWTSIKIFWRIEDWRCALRES